MKNFLRNYFSFNQVETKGIRVLLGILSLLIISYLIMPLFFNKNKSFDSSVYKTQVDSFMMSSTIDSVWDNEKYKDENNNNYKSSVNHQNWSKNNGNQFQMKLFDPNGLPIEIWMAMGLSEKQAKVIKNYEAKGGKFKSKEDVKKQFVISNEFYKKIEPYIVFSEINDEVVTEHKPLSIDINYATREDFMLLNGVKDYLADGIIKYRGRLGGFVSIEQLKEVKYLSGRIYEDIQSHCYITAYSIKKINVNLAEWKEFAAHPYLGADLATKIIDHRKKHGIFKTPEDFRKSGLVDEALYVKLVPYLSFTH